MIPSKDSAIFSGSEVVLAIYFAQFSSDHISALSPAPVQTSFLPISECSFKKSGILILPCLSTSTSTAPESMNLLNSLSAGFVIDKWDNFSFITSQDFSVYTEIVLSKPRDKITRVPISVLNFDGKDVLPFSSIECVNSPINILFLTHYGVIKNFN
jgi:hypothetical protein